VLVTTKLTTHLATTRPLITLHRTLHRQQEGMVAASRRVCLAALFAIINIIGFTCGQEQPAAAALISVQKVI